LKIKKISLYSDGASRGNPGPSGVGVLILDSSGNKLKEFSKYIGHATNNIAEYSALIYALDEALMLKADEVIAHVDSELVCKQINGEYKVKDEKIRPLFDKAMHILRSFKSFEVKHIDRSRNKEADKLANKAINLA
jgi:ribonuclease HI